MSDTASKATGRLGEQLAGRYLEKNHCQIVGRNYRTRFGEIDLIAKTNDEILFCEVKTRTSRDYGYPEQAVDSGKIKRMMLAVNSYLSEKNITGFWRLDIISIELDQATRAAKIRWFKNITCQN